MLFHLSRSTDETMHFLLPLAREYMMEDVLEQAEKFLQIIEPVKMEMLSWAETYGLPKLRQYCMDYAIKSKLESLHEDETFQQVCAKTKVEILYERCRAYELLIAENQKTLSSIYMKQCLRVFTDKQSGATMVTKRGTVIAQPYTTMPYEISWLKTE